MIATAVVVGSALLYGVCIFSRAANDSADESEKIAEMYLSQARRECADSDVSQALKSLAVVAEQNREVRLFRPWGAPWRAFRRVLLWLAE